MAYSSIIKPSTFTNTKLYAGNGSTQSITGVGFQPDWTWIKNRSSTNNNRLFDSVRGAGKNLVSNSTGAEVDAGTGTNGQLRSFISDGFTVGSDGSVNNNNENIVSWNWKAGTSVSGNTTGSGTVKTYTGSVNTTAGFSIVKYVGNGTAGHTIPHNLGAVPRMLIVKRIDDASAWHVYNGSLGATKRVSLNTADAEDADGTAWNNTTPTSSVFTVGESGTTNVNNANTIAYCFAEKQGYSKFGTYIGNGNANGTFVYTGFKPAWVLCKTASIGGEDWALSDNKRNPFNETTTALFPNSASGDQSSNSIDMLSNGFKMRTTGSYRNQSGVTYIYMVFAENPFVASNFNAGTAR